MICVPLLSYSLLTDLKFSDIDLHSLLVSDVSIIRLFFDINFNLCFQGWPSLRSKSEVVSVVDYLLEPSLSYYILWYFFISILFVNPFLSLLYSVYNPNFSYCILC